MRSRPLFVGVLLLLTCFPPAHSQQIREYTAKRTTAPLVIDGQLNEPDWKAAAPTEPFVLYLDGAIPHLSTQVKVLWDDQYLYVGFLCDDPDVWATLTGRDTTTWNEEIVEVLCDPDGDTHNYIEIEVNPLGTVFDSFLWKPYDQGGWDSASWNLNGLKIGIHVYGTIDNLTDVDSGWTAEWALPFREMAFIAPTLNFPPRPGDAWRIMFGRQEFERTGLHRSEISCWNQTDSRAFHVPSKFGRVTFSDASTVSVGENNGMTKRIDAPALLGNYPNPFNPNSEISYRISDVGNVRLAIYDLLGREVKVVVDERNVAGTYRVRFNGSGLATGVYVLRLTVGDYVASHTIVLMR